MTGLRRCGDRRTTVVPGLLLALAVTLGVLVGTAGPASAHAELLSSDPGDGALVADQPAEITLRYTEAVSVNASSVRVLGGDGRRVDRDDAELTGDRRTVRVGLDPGLARGTYLVTWRVISGDSHPVHGTFEFSIGVRSAVDASLAGGSNGSGDDRAWQVAGAVTRITGYLGALVAIGVAVLAVVTGPGPARRRSSRIIAAGAVTGVAAAIVAVPITAAQATGAGWSSFADGAALHQVLGDGVGLGIMAALVGLTLLALNGAQERPDRLLVAVGAGLSAVSMGLVGHPRTTSPEWLAVGSDVVHALAAGVWSGGLVLVLVALRAHRRDDDAVGAARLVSRFSSVATVAVVAVSAMGLVLAYLEVRRLDALTSTTYGRLLIAKVAAAGVVIALGAYNHVRLVPLVADADGGFDGRLRLGRSVGAAAAPVATMSTDDLSRGAAPPPTTTAWRRLDRVLRAELAGLVVVLAVTGVLVNVTPARVAAPVDRTFDTTVAFGDGQVNIVVTPAVAGPNRIHLYLLDAGGRPVDAPRNVRVDLALPARSIGPIERLPVRTGPGHYELAGQSLSVAGRWEITVRERADRFEELRATVTVPVGR